MCTRGSVQGYKGVYTEYNKVQQVQADLFIFGGRGKHIAAGEWSIGS